MKTESLTERQWTEKHRTAHHGTLAKLATNGADGLTLWRKLRRLETEVHLATTAQCNGEAYEGQPFRTEAEWEDYKAGVGTVIREIMGTVPKGFFINGDPRGHALKLEVDAAAQLSGLQKDWGGYGILAAEIN